MMKPIIEMVYQGIQTQIEDKTLKTVQSYGINVDKERLVTALEDAKRFYQEGYADGKKDAREPAHWIEECTWIICSRCRSEFSDEIVFMDRSHVECANPKFCPECGAKMDGDPGDEP